MEPPLPRYCSCQLLYNISWVSRKGNLCALLVSPAHWFEASNPLCTNPLCAVLKCPQRSYRYFTAVRVGACDVLFLPSISRVPSRLPDELSEITLRSLSSEGVLVEQILQHYITGVYITGVVNNTPCERIIRGSCFLLPHSVSSCS